MKFQFVKKDIITTKNNLLNRLHTLIILFFIFSCNDNTKVKSPLPFAETGFKANCQSAIKTLGGEIHAVHFVNESGIQIDKDSVINLLHSTLEYDNFTQNNAKKYSTEGCEIFEKNKKKDECYKMIVTSFLMENPANLPIENPIKTGIYITDFDLYLNEKPKYVSVRILNNYGILRIEIENSIITRLSESIPLGLEKVIYKLDSLKLRKNASR